MRRFRVAALAAGVLSVFLVFDVTGAAAEKIKKKKIVETTVTVQYKPGPVAEEYTGSQFSGKVGSPKSKCVGGRSVVVKRVNGPNIGQTQSAANGDWMLLAGASAVTPGEQVAAQVAKHKIIKEKTKPNGDFVKKKIICQPASETITIP